jgi:alpha-glucosidase
MPWDAALPSFGFTTGTPWLPPGPAHGALAVSLQEGDTSAPLAFARALIKARKAHPALRLGDLELLDAPAPVLAFIRRHEDETICCVFNLSRAPVSYRIARAVPLALGCGAARLEGDRLTLAPLTAWFGLL